MLSSILPSDLYDEILVQTNLYATQQRALKNITKPWNPVRKPELMAFIGLNIVMAFIGLNTAMGIVNLPELRNYWTTNPIIGHPWFCSVMSRDRFMEILRYFHIVDNIRLPVVQILTTTRFGKFSLLLQSL